MKPLIFSGKRSNAAAVFSAEGELCAITLSISLGVLDSGRVSLRWTILNLQTLWRQT